MTCADRDGARRLLVDGEPVTPADLQVRAVSGVDDAGVVFTANAIDDSDVGAGLALDPTAACRPHRRARRAAPPPAGRPSSCGRPRSPSRERSGRRSTASSWRATPPSRAAVGRTCRSAGIAHRHRGALPAPRRLPAPVLLDPYGGPHAARGARPQRPPRLAVVRRPGLRRRRRRRPRHARGGVALGARRAPRPRHRSSTTRSTACSTPPSTPRARSPRVAIRGWSFGGYLAALAVLRHPDVFRRHRRRAGHRWRLYDTHYTERYLGDPGAQPDVVRPLLAAHRRPSAQRPRCSLIHGLADDNVVAAHTLQLSSALLAAGRPHQVLPLVGVTHMTPRGRRREPPAPPAPIPGRSLGCGDVTTVRPVIDKLLRALPGCRRPCDRRPKSIMAALEVLLAVVMFADHHCRGATSSTCSRTDRGLATDTFSLETRTSDQAVGHGPLAWAPTVTRRCSTRSTPGSPAPSCAAPCSRLPQVVDVDSDRDAGRGTVLSEITVRFG